MKLKLSVFIVFIILNFLVYMVTAHNENSKIEKALELHTEKLNTNYKTYRYEQKITAENILSIIKRTSMKYLKKIPNASQSELADLRKKIYQALKAPYRRIKNKGLYQIHFVLPNNHSFLRIHKTEKFGDDLSRIRYSHKYVNKYRKAVEGFETGKTEGLYRYVYPLFDNDGNYICSVGISFSTTYLQKYFINVMNLHTHYLVTKKVLDVKVWKYKKGDTKYFESAESDDYLLVKTPEHSKENCVIKNGSKLKPHKEKIEKLLQKEKPFTIYVENKNDNNDFIEVISFKPVKSTQNGILSWLVSYEKDPFIKSTIHNTIVLRITAFIMFAVMFYFIYKNIDQRVKLQKKTKEQETLLSLFDKGDSVLFKWNNDEHWSVEYVSQSVSRLLGYTQEEFLRGNILYADCIEKNDLQTVIKEVEEATNSNKNNFQHKPYRLITKDKKIKWVLDYTVVLRDDDEITHYLGYIIDITEQKENEKLIAEQSKLVAMGEMIGNIAHQWRQPLSAISTGATGLKLQKEYNALTDQQFEQMCDAINDNAQYLSKTIDDFTDFIKGDRKKIEFNLTGDIESFLHLVEGAVKSNDIQIIKDIKENININGYPNELIQCFINIFNNAKDALKEQEDERLIFISAELKNDKVIISFKDNAGGIPEDVLPHIFEPYFTTKHKSKGTGLGLHMTYNLITEGMNGTIVAENVNYEYKGSHYTGAQLRINLPI